LPGALVEVDDDRFGGVDRYQRREQQDEEEGSEKRMFLVRCY
jgi:hypothetical protein